MVEKIRKRMREKGIIRMSQLSRLTGIPYSTLKGLFDTNFSAVKVSTLKAIAECLDCTMDFMVYGEEKEEGLSEVSKTNSVSKPQLTNEELIDYFARCNLQYDIGNKETVESYRKVKKELLERLEGKRC